MPGTASSPGSCPLARRQWYELVAGAFDSHFLACSVDECALFELDLLEIGQLRKIPFGTVTQGRKVSWLFPVGDSLCVGGDGPDAWCSDRATWSCEDAERVLEETIFPYGRPLFGAASCPGLKPEQTTQVRRRVLPCEREPLGVDSEGRVVLGTSANPVRCCHVYPSSEHFVDAARADFGISEN